MNPWNKPGIYVKRTGMSMTDIAKKTGISTSHISKMMNRRRDPSWKLLKMMSRRLDMSIVEIIEKFKLEGRKRPKRENKRTYRIKT
jgi:transcriptional regulator with XRE-family HTH domain